MKAIYAPMGSERRTGADFGAIKLAFSHMLRRLPLDYQGLVTTTLVDFPALEAAALDTGRSERIIEPQLLKARNGIFLAPNGSRSCFLLVSKIKKTATTAKFSITPSWLLSGQTSHSEKFTLERRNGKWEIVEEDSEWQEEF